MVKKRPGRFVPLVPASVAFLALALLLAPVPAAPDIIITGSPEFVMMVQDALNKFAAAGGRAGEIVSGLEASGNDHVITEATDNAWTDFESTDDATTPDAGGTGDGTGSTVHWDPEFAPETKGTEDNDGDGMPDPLPNDPCNVLIHELSHADDADNGTDDPRPDPSGSGIMTAEVEATADENRFRKGDGQDPRNDYSCDPLPPDAVCPPDAKAPTETHRAAIALRLGGPMSLAPPLGVPASRPGRPTAGPGQPAMPIPLPKVTLNGVSLQSLYQVGDEVQLRLTLTNQSFAPTLLSGLVEGNLRVVSLTRDGVAVPTSSSAARTYEGLALVLEHSLTSVPPGGQLTVPWSSNPSLALGGETLTTVALASDGRHTSMGFSVDAPGDYELRVIYQYAGTVPPNSGVFTDRTNVAGIRFSVR
jgi:hypothetical protein